MKLILQDNHNNKINFIGLRNQNLVVLDFAHIQSCLWKTRESLLQAK
jgi:hypothetical protein